MTYNRDTNSRVWATDGEMRSASVSNNTQVSSFKAKTGAAFQKLGARSISPVAVLRFRVSPVAVLRFRVSFDYGEKLMQAGEYNLPSVITSD